MNGAESLVRSVSAAGVEICFANPGTTEMPLVAALDAVPGVRAVLGLFEGVCTGAADGWGRMRRRPAMTLLHLGPGFANGIANLHNAARAGSPVVNLVGDHASWHRNADAPLTSDIDSLARPVSGWLRTSSSPGALPRDACEAVAAALTPPGQVATLVVPQDCQWGEARGPAAPVSPPAPGRVGDDAVRAAARALRAGGALLYLGGPALEDRALRAAARVRQASGCAAVHETFTARIERGAGVPAFDRLPYFPEQAREHVATARSCVLVGAREPVAFFGYEGQPSAILPDGCERLELARAGDDVTGALEALADELGAGPLSLPDSPAPASTGAPADGPLDPGSLGAVLAALQPEGAIVVDEGATSGLPWYVHAGGAPPHTVLALTGGAIGQGLPCAAGAALACPDRRVVALQADGSGLYTLQALWTMARESLDVSVVLCANRRYRILQVELARSGVAEPGPQARSLTNLDAPEIDWTAMARSLGVPAVRVEDTRACRDALARSLREPGPSLVEVVL